MTCPRLGKWIGGCHFEPRYDLGPADTSAFESFKGLGIPAILEKLRSKTYRGDVCTRCGKAIDNPSEITPNQAGS